MQRHDWWILTFDMNILKSHFNGIEYGQLSLLNCTNFFYQIYSIKCSQFFEPNAFRIINSWILEKDSFFSCISCNKILFLSEMANQAHFDDKKCFGAIISMLFMFPFQHKCVTLRCIFGRIVYLTFLLTPNCKQTFIQFKWNWSINFIKMFK